jgi:ABC-2 type transport system permease protein
MTGTSRWTAPPAPRARQVETIRLAFTHTRQQLTETARMPVMLLSIVVPPALAMLFFVVPFIGDDPELATLVTASFVAFGVMLSCLFHFGVAVAAARESAWGTYLRTLPGGLAPQVISSVLTGMVVVAAAVIPISLVGALLTPATASPGQLLAGLGALLVTVAGFTIMGIAVGYLLSLRATVVVVNLLILPLAFGGGLFTDPEDTPALIAAISPYVPTRGASDLVRAALADGYRADPTALAMFGLWSLALGALAVWGYRRDEGRRFD